MQHSRGEESATKRGEVIAFTGKALATAALNTIAVGVHAQTGLWACHMHRPALAYRYLATSREIAAVSGDRSLRARSLGALSYLFSSAPRGGQGGNPQHCLELLDEALGLAHHADPFTRGWLFTWRADQYATIGNLDSAQADVEACATVSTHAGQLCPAVRDLDDQLRLLSIS